MTYPELTNMSTNIVSDLFRWCNVVTGGYFGLGMLSTAWFIIFFGLMYSGRQRAASTATIVCAILAVILRMISVVNDQVMIGAIVLGAIGILFMFLTKEQI